ncbi:hypothetical protein CYMTET_39348 [Cymbomonas tetramitiformis]|uniref:Uncharacterized protein n=1 Tax=Cymbomonas tetramitiformis TaxID=36881 RepID=A0AAE0CBM4_9CHLO|nr:hypothetical protein CYMTET_39348 [Cymbomonas tetramitiformis]
MVYTRQKTGATRQLFAIDKSVRLDDNIRGKPTDPTTPVAVPAVATSSDTAGQKAARERYEAVTKLVQTIYDERRDKSIAKDIRSDVLGAKDVRFKASDKDKPRLGPLVRRLTTEFETARLGVDIFDFNDETIEVHPRVNALLYHILTLIIEPDSLASTVLGGTYAEDRDGRRSLVDLIKFTVRQARSVDCQGLYRQLEYPAREDPRPILEEEQRLVLENEEEDWKPTDASRRSRMFKMLDKKFYRQLREKYAVPADLAKVSLIGLSFEIVEVYLSWCEEEDEEGLGSAAYSGGERGASRSDDVERDRGGDRGSASLLRRIAECEVRLQESEDTRVAQAKRIADLEYLVRNGSGDLSRATTRRPGGFRPGGGPLKNAKVAFDRTTRTAKMECPRCPGQHHGWYQCENKGKGVEHQPTNREVKTMALVQIFNDAAQAGAGAMRACIEQHGDPLVLEDGVVLPRQRRDLSYLGFTVEQGGSGGEDTDSDFGDDDAPASFQHISLCQPVVPRANALLASAAASRRSIVPEPRVIVTQPTGEFTGSIVTLDRVATEAERVAECEEAIRRMKQEDLAAQQHRTFCGGFTVEPAADQGIGEHLAVQDVFGEIGCEPCERGPEPVVQLELVVLLRQVVQLELVVPMQLVVLQLVVLQSTTSTKITTTNWSSVSLLAV